MSDDEFGDFFEVVAPSSEKDNDEIADSAIVSTPAKDTIEGVQLDTAIVSRNIGDDALISDEGLDESEDFGEFKTPKGSLHESVVIRGNEDDTEWNNFSTPLERESPDLHEKFDDCVYESDVQEASSTVKEENYIAHMMVSDGLHADTLSIDFNDDCKHTIISNDIKCVNEIEKNSLQEDPKNERFNGLESFDGPPMPVPDESNPSCGRSGIKLDATEMEIKENVSHQQSSNILNDIVTKREDAMSKNENVKKLEIDDAPDTECETDDANFGVIKSATENQIEATCMGQRHGLIFNGKASYVENDGDRRINREDDCHTPAIQEEMFDPTKNETEDALGDNRGDYLGDSLDSNNMDDEMISIVSNNGDDVEDDFGSLKMNSSTFVDNNIFEDNDKTCSAIISDNDVGEGRPSQNAFEESGFGDFEGGLNNAQDVNTSNDDNTEGFQKIDENSVACVGDNDFGDFEEKSFDSGNEHVESSAEDNSFGKFEEGNNDLNDDKIVQSDEEDNFGEFEEGNDVQKGDVISAVEDKDFGEFEEVNYDSKEIATSVVKEEDFGQFEGENDSTNNESVTSAIDDNDFQNFEEGKEDSNEDILVSIVEDNDFGEFTEVHDGPECALTMEDPSVSNGSTVKDLLRRIFSSSGKSIDMDSISTLSGRRWGEEVPLSQIIPKAKDLVINTGWSSGAKAIIDMSLFDSFIAVETDDPVCTNENFSTEEKKSVSEHKHESTMPSEEMIDSSITSTFHEVKDNADERGFGKFEDAFQSSTSAHHERRNLPSINSSQENDTVADKVVDDFGGFRGVHETTTSSLEGKKKVGSVKSDEYDNFGNDTDVESFGNFEKASTSKAFEDSKGIIENEVAFDDKFGDFYNIQGALSGDSPEDSTNGLQVNESFKARAPMNNSSERFAEDSTDRNKDDEEDFGDFEDVQNTRFSADKEVSDEDETPTTTDNLVTEVDCVGSLPPSSKREMRETSTLPDLSFMLSSKLSIPNE